MTAAETANVLGAPESLTNGREAQTTDLLGSFAHATTDLSSSARHHRRRGRAAAPVDACGDGAWTYVRAPRPADGMPPAAAE